MVSACLCQATVRKTKLPCLRRTKAYSNFCGYHRSHTKKAVDEDCSICLCEVPPDIPCFVTPCCKHALHQTCMDKWTTINNNCPLCRANIRKTSARRNIIITRVEAFRRNYQDTDTFLEVGAFFAAIYQINAHDVDVFILDTSNGEVIGTREHIEIIV